MDITPQMRAILDGLPVAQGTQAAGGDTGLGRLGKNVANLPGNIIEGIISGTVGLAQLGNPGTERDRVDLPNFFDVSPAPAGFNADTVGDFFVGKGGLADIIGQTIVPAGILGRAGKALGMGRKLETGAIASTPALEALKFGGGFMVPEAGRDHATNTDIGVAGALGAATGPLGFLPMRYRLPASAVIAGLHGSYETVQRGGFAGGVAAAADFVTGLIPHTWGARKAIQPEVPPAPEILRLTDRETPMGRGVVEGSDVIAPEYNRRGLPAPEILRLTDRDTNFDLVGKPYDPAIGGPIIPPQVQRPSLSWGHVEIATLQNTPEPRFIGPVASRQKPNPKPIVPVEPPKIVEPPKVPSVREQVKWNTQERAHAEGLRKSYDKLDDRDLKELISDIDNEIANTLDEGSIRSYTLARETATQVIENRKAAVPVEATVVKPGAVEKIKRNQRVSYIDELGERQHGTVVGFTKEEARIVFDGASGETKVPRTRVTGKDVPPKEIATLQKLDADDIESAHIGENLSQIDESMKRVGVEAIERQQEKVPGMREKVTDPDADLQGGRFATTRERSDATIEEMEPMLHEEAKAALNRVVEAVKTAINPNLRIAFDSLGADRLGHTEWGGKITINIQKFAQDLKKWHKMSAQEKGKVFQNFTRVLSHEGGHAALNFVRATEPATYKLLVDEFSRLSYASRENILRDYHKEVGVNEWYQTQYTAGNPHLMAETYNIHPENIASLQTAGMEEFFSELFSAHIFGKLKEELLPKEMLSVWQKIKGFFSKILMSFKPDTVWGKAGEAEEIAAFHNFKEMMEEVQVRFHAADGKNYKSAMKKAEKIKASDELKSSKRDAELGYRDIANKRMNEDAEYALFGHEKIDDIGDEAYLDDLIGGRYMRLGGLAGHQLTQELGSAAAGAIMGGVAGPTMTDGQVSMAEGILMGGIMGALGPRAIKALIAMPKATGATFHHKTFGESLAAIFKGGSEGVAADAATGHGSSIAKFMRFLERNMNLHLPPELYNAVTTADGAAAWALHTVDDAFKKSRNFKPSAAFTKETETFLKGGSLSAYKTAAAGLGPESKTAANFFIASREAIATLQKHFAAGLPEGSFKDMIMKSMASGDYLTRQYRIFHDPKYRPNPTQVEAAALKYVADNKGVFNLETARQVIEDYIHQVKTEGVSFRGSVTDVGKKLDSYLWERRTDLDPIFRDMLGEYKDPREKVLGTIQHLYTSSITGKLIDTVSGLKDPNGLPFSLGREEHTNLIDALKTAIATGAIPPGKTIATLQKELEVLRAYVPLEPNIKYGKISGKMVSRFVRDQLATFDSPWGLMDGSIMRGMAKFHNNIKVARTALNPITVVRNIMAMPILTAISGANPLTDIPRAWKAIRANGALMKEMLEQGIMNVDSVRGEMLRDVDYVRMLNVDNSIFGLMKKGVNKALDFYRWPDMLVRSASYIRAKAKFSKELGLPEGHVDVINKARDWTNRYTVNYANVAPIVKTLRQVPFTNLFISYTAEITRIAKNLVQDAFKHPDVGQRVRAASMLGGLAATPFVLEKFATLQLSEKDRKDWEKARDLMPAYARPKHLIVLGREGDGRFRYIDMTPIVQIDAFTQMGRALASGDLQAAAAVNPIISWENTPAVNIVAEQLTGEDLRSGRPINKSLLTRARAVLDDIMPPIMPGGYEFKRISDALTETETGELGVTNSRTGRRTTPGEVVGSFLTGMRIATVDADKLHQFAIADAKRKLANEAAYLRDVLQTDATTRLKQRATERYRKAQEQILLELMQKVQP